MEWHEELRNSARTFDDLVRIGAFEESERAWMEPVLERAPMSIPPYYLSLMDFSNPDDPIRKLAIPSVLETDRAGSLDTSGEGSNTVLPGLQHKYRETVMMLSTNACAMYCRHCFRKRLVGLDDAPDMSGCASDANEVRAYLLDHPEVTNVLVSGGDALLNSNARIRDILDALVDIESLGFIRIATRVPVSLPQRITTDTALVGILREYCRMKQIFVVTQFDHPREITSEAEASVRMLLDAGIPVRNQTVLLRGVNADVDTLSTLLRGLTRIGVEPYYVFQCRPVLGVKTQFQVPFREGVRIVEGAKAQQNGFGKAFKFCMSHVTGKIEILGELPDGRMAFKYHEAKDRADLGRIFVKEVGEGQAWFADDEDLGRNRFV